MKYDVCQISNLYDIVNGYAFKSSRFKVSGGIPIVRIANITDSGINLENVIFYENMPEYEKFKIKNNDVLIALSGATTGKFGIYDKDEIAYLNQRVARFRAKDDNPTLSKYLYYFLYLKRQEILRSAYGGAQPNISTKQIEIMQIPFWGLESIEKLIKRIDSLFADIDAGLEKINEVKAKLDSIKQSILKQAFDGTLIGAMKEIEFQQITNLVDIRDDLRKPINSENRKKRIEGKEYFELYPYYGATGQVGFIDDYLINGEYVLVGEDGAPFLDRFRDKAYIIQGKSWVNNHAHILQAIAGRTYNKFIKYYLNYFRYDDYVNGTTRLKLTKGMLEQIPVPIFNLKDQEKIVAKIDSLFADIDNQFEKINQLEQQLNSLKQSILKQAFEGNLV